MDIEDQVRGSQQKGSPKKGTNNYVLKSVKSRMSNQSLMSIGGGFQPRNNQEKISLESNMSEKVHRQLNQRGLFQQLANNQNDMMYSPTRYYGSNPNDYRISRMSEEQNNPQKMQEQSQYKMVNQQSNKQEFIVQQKPTCRCSKSKCLLMYCECFSKGEMCNPECKCYQCRNNEQFEDKRQKARQVVLQKDPNAFKNKLEMVGAEEVQLAYKRGCNCKKTHCFKKYCECFNANVKCTYLCNCQGCMNGGQNAYKQ